MKVSLFVVSILAVSCTCLNAFDKDTCKENLQKLLATKAYKNVQTSYSVIRIHPNKEVLLQHNEEEQCIPASTIKVLLSLSSLHYLDKHKRFQTVLATDGKIRKNTLDGNLILIGGGDPSLKTRNLKEAARQLRNRGITAVNGHIYYDDSLFKEELNPRYTDARHYYAPASALSCDSNYLSLFFSKNEKKKLSIKPPTPYANVITLANLQKTRRYTGRPRLTLKEKPWGDTYYIYGQATLADQYNGYLRVLISRPSLYAATQLKKVCQEVGIKIKGDIKRGINNKKNKVLVNINSKPVISLLRKMNAQSDNVSAKLLQKHIEKKHDKEFKKTVSYKRGLEAFCINELKWEQNNFYLDDASGLSKMNKVSSRQLTQMLEWSFKNGDMFADMLNILKKQDKDSYENIPKPGNGIVTYFKTGTLSQTGVNNMIGFIEDQNTDTWYIISILCHDKKAKEPRLTGTLSNPILKHILEALTVTEIDRRRSDMFM
ncbi:MAG: D-alanyl-D-alanine carboxypeptidase/D-alanyl-D-alanine-endopeptidase [bacterium]